MSGLKLPPSLRHRNFRLMIAAFAVSSVGSWAYGVALAVWVFERTGSASWVGAATIGRFIPGLVISTYGGVLAERFERIRLMVVLDIAATVVMGGLAVEVAVGTPVLVGIVTAGLAAMISTVYQPAAAAMTPQLVGSRDLGSANALRNTIDNIAVIAGPGLGALLLLAGPPAVAIGVNALTFLLSAAFMSRIHVRSTPVDVTEGGEAGALRQMLVGVKAIVGSPTSAVLVAYSVLATVVFGADTVQFVVLSRDVLGTGAGGYGYLLAGMGLGGVLGAGVVSRLEKLPRLGPVILLGMAVYCLPTLLFLGVSNPEAGFVIEVVRGAGTLVVDVLALTALQRSLDPQVLGRVFGVFETLVLSAILIGAAITPPMINGWSLDASIWVLGAGMPLLCLLGWPALRSMDARAAERRAALLPWIEALRACDLFEAVSEGPIEQLAGEAEVVEAAPDEIVINEGAESNAFFVVLRGSLHVSSQGEHGTPIQLRDLGPGDYFGEIGLIEQSPRTATVRAGTSSQLLKISGADFIGALTESAPSALLLDGAALRLSRTHPTHSLTRAALGGVSASGE